MSFFDDGDNSARSFDLTDIVAKSGVDPAIETVVEFRVDGLKVKTDESWRLRVGEVGTTPFGRIAYMHDDFSGNPVVEIPDGLTMWGFWQEPATEPELGDVPASGDEHRRRTDALERAFEDAGLIANLRTARGWYPIIEAAAKAVLALAPAGGVISISNGIGCQRLNTENLDGIGGAERQYLYALEEWVESMTSRRCMVFGTPGSTRYLGPAVLTLSDEAMRIDPGLRAQHMQVPAMSVEIPFRP